jgi:hypothetical protein
MSTNIGKMTRGEWLIYRDDLLDDFINRGNVLKPRINCGACDPRDQYTCLICEIDQVDNGGKQ